MTTENKIKLPSTGGEITEEEFSKRIDQIMHILSAVASCDGRQLLGYHGKMIGWCMPEMRDQVIGYKLALCKLRDDHTKLRGKEVHAEELIQGLSDDVIELSKKELTNKEQYMTTGKELKKQNSLLIFKEDLRKLKKKVLKETLNNSMKIF